MDHPGVEYRPPTEHEVMVGEIRKLCGYFARSEVQSILGTMQPYRVERHGFKVYSQNDEDGIIEYIFDRLLIDKGTFIEIGVGSGLECNTLYLLHKGWHGIWIDANPGFADWVAKKFQPLVANGDLDTVNALVTAENINKLITVSQVDFMSIDVDGMDIYLWEALEFMPKVVCIEYNAKFKPPLRKIVPYDAKFNWSGTDYFGASLQALDDLAKAKGYKLVATNVTGVNAFFVRTDLLDKWPYSLHNDCLRYYNPPCYWLQHDAFQRCGHLPDFGPYQEGV